MNKSIIKYAVTGTGGDGQPWTVTGQVNETMVDCFEPVMIAAFQQLTSGKAVFGQPGKTCRGPYKIVRILLEAG